MRVCRVVPDLPAVDRVFDYLVPDEMAAAVRPGTMVRIELRGRRVGGWVVADGVQPEAEPADLVALAKVSSAGPPPDLVELTAWAATRWAGPRATFLRAASPPNVVPAAGPAPGNPPPGPDRQHPADRPAERPADDPEVEEIATRARDLPVGVVRWPPASRMAELLRRLVAPAGSTLVIVPDARRIGMLAGHLGAAGFTVVAFHPHQSDAERTRAWVDARRGECVVVGGRVAAWAPVPDLAAALVVDEADEALKEERAPAWHARELLAERAARAGARVTTVTPAPTLDVLVGAEVLTPSRRRERRGWGAVAAIDRRGDPPGSGMFSPELVGPLRQGVAEGRVVCVLNRKGRARLLACGGCGRVVTCERCEAAVAEDEAGLTCRRCEARRPRVCAVCASTALRRLRPGIARMREELEALVPRAEVAEVDAATGSLPDAPLLVGTEAVLHRVEGAALVAFLDFDQELLAPRFRAAEQALWLVVRALRCVGLRDDGRRVLVQTRHPDHEVVRAVVNADPGIVAAAERERRRALDLPPFSALAQASGREDAVVTLVDALRDEGGVEVLGPVPAGTSVSALVRARDHAALGAALARARRRAGGAPWPRVEVDPLRT